MELIRIVASQSQRYREISFFFLCPFSKDVQFFCIEDGQGLFYIFSERYFKLNLKASDRLHLV